MAIDSRTTNYNYAKIVVGSDGWGLDVNANFDGIDTDIKTAYDRGLSSAEKTNFTELTDGSTTTLHTHTGILALKTFLVLANKNFWGEIYYKDTDEIVILPKASPFGSFIGAVLNDGTFLEASSAITVKYDTPANSGNILNGLGKVASSWQILIAYEDSSGDLAFGFSYMPETTFSDDSPTTTLTLAQVDSKNIGLLFPEDARFVVWEDADEFETPIFYQDGAFSAANYDPSKSLYIDSRTATVLTLNQALEKTDFASGSTVYQVDNFKPYDYSTGALASVIGARGWNDTGVRIYINSSSNIREFVNNDDYFYFTEQAIQTATGAVDKVYNLFDIIPPDVNDIEVQTYIRHDGTPKKIFSYLNYATTTQITLAATPSAISDLTGNFSNNRIPIIHGLGKFDVEATTYNDSYINCIGYGRK